MSETAWFKNKGHTLTSEFRAVDRDHSGRISSEEFRGWCAGKGFSMNAEEATVLMSFFDTDGGGQIDISEFIQSIEKYSLGS